MITLGVIVELKEPSRMTLTHLPERRTHYQASLMNILTCTILPLIRKVTWNAAESSSLHGRQGLVCESVISITYFLKELQCAKKNLAPTYSFLPAN